MNIFTLVCIIVPMSSVADDYFSDLTDADSTFNLLNVTHQDMKDGNMVFQNKETKTFTGGKFIGLKGTTTKATMLKDYTVMLWVKISKRSTGWTRLVGKGSRTGSTRNYGLWVSREGWPLSQSVCVNPGVNAYNRNTYVPLNKWTHLTGIFRKDQDHRLYMNAKLVERVPTKGTPCENNLPVTVGGVTGYPTLIGAVKDVRLYDYAITLTSLKNIVSGRTPSPTPSPRTPSPTHPPTGSPTVGEYSTIIALINALISEGKSEISEIQNETAILTKDVERHKELVETALGNEEVALEKKNEAGRLLAVADGVAQTTCKSTSETVPGLEDEIELFEKVIGLLNGLSNGKELVEKDQDKIRSFISLADQADPKKVANVITLVQGLIATAKADIAKAVKQCEDAKAAFLAAEKVYNQAFGTWTALVKAREAAEAALEKAVGKLAAATEHAAHRIPVVDSEIADLEEVLALIKSLE